MSKRDLEQELHDTKRSIAILAGCLVEAMSNDDPLLRDRFVSHIDAVFDSVRLDDEAALKRLELLNWTRDLLTGSVDGLDNPAHGDDVSLESRDSEA